MACPDPRARPVPALEGDRGCLWQGLGGWARLGAVGASEATCACPGPSCTQGSQDSAGGVAGQHPARSRLQGVQGERWR